MLNEIIRLLHDIKAELISINETLNEKQPTDKQAVSEEDLQYLQSLASNKSEKAFLVAAEQIKQEIKS